MKSVLVIITIIGLISSKNPMEFLSTLEIDSLLSENMISINVKENSDVSGAEVERSIFGTVGSKGATKIMAEKALKRKKFFEYRNKAKRELREFLGRPLSNHK